MFYRLPSSVRSGLHPIEKYGGFDLNCNSLTIISITKKQQLQTGIIQLFSSPFSAPLTLIYACSLLDNELQCGLFQVN